MRNTLLFDTLAIVVKIKKQPKRDKTKDVLATLMYIAVFVECALALPQVIEIVSNKSSENVSLLTWLGYSVLTLIWVAYSIYIKDKPIILYSIASTIMNSLVVASILIYS